MSADASSSQLVPANTILRTAILGVLFVAALALRLSGLGAPPTEFHPMRQFRAAIIARDLYFQENPSAAPDWLRAVASSSSAQEELLEPRIVENLAAFMYDVAGGEYLWLPRLFSILCWLAGGYLLFRLTTKLFAVDAGLAAATFYLLTPFAVLASRVLQPDPLMILLYLAGLNAMLWYDDQPSSRRLVVAGLVTSTAPLVKPISLFGLFIAFASLNLYHQRGWRGLINPRVIVYGAILTLPMAVYYLAGVMARTGMQNEVSVDIIPSLLVYRTYWGGWFTQIGKAVGPLTFLLSLVGLALLKPGRGRALVAGLWAGYLMMGLVFTYTISTHDYYQLQLIPIVAICLTPIILPLMERVRSLFTLDVTWAIFVSLFIVILAVFSAYENWWRTTFRYFYQSADPIVAQIGPVIGQELNHSSRVVMLGEADGRALAYYAEITGAYWPTNSTVGLAVAGGHVTPDAARVFNSLKASLSPEYFVITDFHELGNEPQLVELLSHYRVLDQTSSYIIYDLRQPLP